jgi:hypothetical protein
MRSRVTVQDALEVIGGDPRWTSAALDFVLRSNQFALDPASGKTADLWAGVDHDFEVLVEPGDNWKLTDPFDVERGRGRGVEELQQLLSGTQLALGTGPGGLEQKKSEDRFDDLEMEYGPLAGNVTAALDYIYELWHDGADREEVIRKLTGTPFEFGEQEVDELIMQVTQGSGMESKMDEQQKVSQAEANYRQAERNPADKRKCKNCKSYDVAATGTTGRDQPFFAPCKVVEGTVSREGVCDLHKFRDEESKQKEQFENPGERARELLAAGEPEDAVIGALMDEFGLSQDDAATEVMHASMDVEDPGYDANILPPGIGGIIR